MTSPLDALSESKQLCFVHLPKTAGSTLVENLKLALKENAYPFYSASQKLAMKNLDPGSLKSVVPLFLSGHFSIGEFREIAPPSSVYLSISRHPVDRLFSYYRHAARNQKPNAVSQAASKGSFEEFLLFLREEAPRILINQQCRFLTTESRLKNKLDLMFEEVLPNLDDVPYILESFERCDSVFYHVARYLGLNGVTFAPRKVSKNLPGEVTPGCEELVLSHNAEDLKLYEHSRRTRLTSLG